jgi:hypothetical protein
MSSNQTPPTPPPAKNQPQQVIDHIAAAEAVIQAAVPADTSNDPHVQAIQAAFATAGQVAATQISNTGDQEAAKAAAQAAVIAVPLFTKLFQLLKHAHKTSSAISSPAGSTPPPGTTTK